MVLNISIALQHKIILENEKNLEKALVHSILPDLWYIILVMVFFCWYLGNRMQMQIYLYCGKMCSKIQLLKYEHPKAEINYVE